MRICVTVFLLLTSASLARAGDLSPPPGPVMPTDRVRIHGPTQAIPVVIDEPGSYVLTGSITGVAGEHGIVIESDNVTLDLNGFSVTGVAGSLSGITSTVPRIAVTVSNGIVSSWGAGGVVLTDVTLSRITGVTAHSNIGDGISTGNSSTIENCFAHMNTTGIRMEDAGTVRNSVVSFNTDDGLSLRSGCIARGVTARGNASDGIDATIGALIVGCNATANGMNGILVSSRSRIEGNHVSGNVGAGIRVTGNHCTIEGNSASFNAFGVQVIGTGNTIVRNTTNTNTTQNYDLNASNATGIIIVVNGGGIVSSAQPWANVSN